MAEHRRPPRNVPEPSIRFDKLGNRHVRRAVQQETISLKRNYRLSQFENLERRRLLAVTWRNPVDAYDVNQSGTVSPLDALLVINDIARRDVRTLPADKIDPAEAFYDVSGDGRISPIDALQVINSIARNSQYTLLESNAPASEFSVVVGLGQAAVLALINLRLGLLLKVPSPTRRAKTSLPFIAILIIGPRLPSNLFPMWSISMDSMHQD